MTIPVRTVVAHQRHALPLWMRRVNLIIGGLSLCLLLALVGMLVGTPFDGLASFLGRNRQPPMDPAIDPGWVPGLVVLSVWFGIATCVVVTWVSDRGHESRHEVFAIVGALLSALGISSLLSAAMCVPWPDNRPPVAVDLGNGLCLLGATASALGLLRIAWYRGKARGLWLATYALVAPLAAMHWVHMFLVAPAGIQPVASESYLDLPVIEENPRYTLLGEPHQVEILWAGGAPLIRVASQPASSDSWKSALHEVAEGMSIKHLEVDGKTYDLPGEGLVILADGKVPVSAVLDVVQAAQAERIWKIFFAVRGRNNGERGAIVYFLPITPVAPEDWGDLLELRVADDDPAGAPNMRLQGHTSRDQGDLLLRAMTGQQGVLRIAVEPTLSWQQVLNVAAKVVEHRTLFFLESLVE